MRYKTEYQRINEFLNSLEIELTSVRVDKGEYYTIKCRKLKKRLGK